MAKFFKTEKNRKRAITALSALLAASLSLGVFAACTNDVADTDDDSDVATLPVDDQVVKNGNFEFYDDVVKENVKEKKNLISTPNSWTFNSGSPSSDTLSGIIDATEWDYISKTGGYTFTSVDDAVAHWDDDNVSGYDRLKFYKDYKTEIDALASGSEAKKLFDEYSYRVDFEDLQYLNEEVGDTFLLHDDAKQREDGDTSVLMIHNRRTSENVRGTAQSYNSSTTVTLASGTAAEISVWVKTAALYHYEAHTDAEKENGEKDVEVTSRAGAYLAVTHTVGGNSISNDFQIKNINTRDVEDNNGWQKLTLYVRASSYASSTIRIKLGLGLGSSDDRYEAVDGYAFFDDLVCTRITSADYDKAVSTETPDGVPESHQINLTAKDKTFDLDNFKTETKSFAFDLDSATEYTDVDLADFTDADIALTEEVSGRKTWTSADKGFGTVADSITKKTTYGELKTLAESNPYLQNIYPDDFENKFPFYTKGAEEPDEDETVILLLSANGAAYTAKLPEITLEKDKNILISFWVKTSKLPSGKSGAGAVLVDGLNSTTISAFDSTDVATVDLDDDHEDINLGWVQCFFFVSNDTDEAKTFHIELTYGPTALSSATENNFCDGYAAFTHFKKYENFSDTQLGYAPSSGDYAKKVALTGSVDPVTRFDTVKAGEDIEQGLALPTNFTAVVSGSHYVSPEGDDENAVPEGLYYGLLNRQYAQNYKENMSTADDPAAKWGATLGLNSAADGKTWWTDTFGNASQPLAIVNTGEEAKSLGLFAADTTISSSSYHTVSVRVKVSAGAAAYLYLTDKSDLEKGFGTRLKTDLPYATYWYDEDGNICSGDPSDKDFDEKTGVLYYLQDNGLYKKAGDTGETYYANLANYKEKDGNLVTKDDTVAFYGKKDGANTVYYAYYDEDTDTYSVPVTALPTDDGNGNPITRYAYTDADAKEAAIKVTGTDDWVTVSFFVHTGNESKTYRLEVWAGAREGEDAKIPAGAYVFFDNYKTSSTSFDSMRTEAVDALKRADNEVDEDDRLTDKDIALYYTFTFFDSADYLRYDKTTDTEGAGDPWAEYDQSSYSEMLAYLFCDDHDGTLLNAGAQYSLFLDYSAVDVTVARATNDTTTDDTTDDEEEDEGDPGDVWLILSSALLAIVLLFAIGAVIVRALLKKMRKEGRIKPRAPKAKKAKAPKAKQEPEAPAETPAERPATPADENDPYNE